MGERLSTDRINEWEGGTEEQTAMQESKSTVTSNA